MIHLRLFISTLLMLLGACASGPRFDTTSINRSLLPQQAVAEGERVRATSVLWGGVLIGTTHLKQATQFEILAYPLSESQRPLLEQPPLGRFLAEQDGYVEAADYTQGRLITVTGVLQGNSTGRIGEADYTYPLVKISQQYLWPREGAAPETRFHFGFGIMIRN